MKKLRSTKIFVLFLLFKALKRKKKIVLPAKKSHPVLNATNDKSIYRSLLYLLERCAEQPEFATICHEDLQNAMARFQLMRAEYEYCRTTPALQKLQQVRQETRTMLLEAYRVLVNIGNS